MASLKSLPLVLTPVHLIVSYALLIESWITSNIFSANSTKKPTSPTVILNYHCTTDDFRAYTMTSVSTMMHANKP